MKTINKLRDAIKVIDREIKFVTMAINNNEATIIKVDSLDTNDGYYTHIMDELISTRYNLRKKKENLIITKQTLEGLL